MNIVSWDVDNGIKWDLMRLKEKMFMNFLVSVWCLSSNLDKQSPIDICHLLSQCQCSTNCWEPAGLCVCKSWREGENHWIVWKVQISDGNVSHSVIKGGGVLLFGDTAAFYHLPLGCTKNVFSLPLNFFLHLSLGPEHIFWSAGHQIVILIMIMGHIFICVVWKLPFCSCAVIQFIQ